MTKNEGLCTAIKDMKQNIDRKTPIILGIIGLVAGIVMFFAELLLCSGKACEVLTSLTGVMSGILGFIIAASAIMYALPDRAIRRLSSHADDGSIPYDVIIANMAFTSLMDVMAIVLTLATQFFSEHSITFRVLFSLSIAVSLFVLLLCCNIILHLYTSRTFIKY